jgi:hypothetical protein
MDKMKGIFSQKLKQTNECENSDMNERANEITVKVNGLGLPYSNLTSDKFIL